jgi:hypothetical protein
MGTSLSDVPMGQTHPQKYRPRGMVSAKTKNAQMNVPIKARTETMEESAIKGSIRRKKSIGNFIFKG